MSEFTRHCFDATITNWGKDYQSTSGRNTLEDYFRRQADLLAEGAQTAHRLCPVCHSDLYTQQFVKYTVPICVCSVCAFEYVPDVVVDTQKVTSGKTFLDCSSGEHLRFIQSETYRHFASLRYKYELGIIEKFVSEDGVLFLDVGCSTGQMMEEAAQKGWQVFGVELSGEAAQKAAALFPNVIHAPYAPGQFLQKYFNVVVSLDVLEHVSDPEHFLRELARSLKDDGVLFIQVPNAGSLSCLLKQEKDNIYNGLIHLNYFTQESLRALATNAGLKTVHMETVLSESQVLDASTLQECKRLLNSDHVHLPVTRQTADAILDAGFGYKILAVFAKEHSSFFSSVPA